MTDLAHYFGSDLTIAANGDVLTVDGADAVTQRVYRRLMTALGDYWWQPAYGSGLPARVGEPVSLPELQAIVSEQMALEAAVDQTRPITVSVSGTDLGSVIMTIAYTDAASGQPATLSLT